MRHILIVNDDGIDSEGITVLAKLSQRYGKISVVAPDRQCSGKSMSITTTFPMTAERADFPVPGVEAWKLDGKPADCAMAGCGGLLEEKPDVVFSGINQGYNLGVDILYSGTVGGAMQALCHGIPGFAFSIGREAKDFSVIDAWFDRIVDDLLERPVDPGSIWNVNFPACTVSEVKGIAFGCRPAPMEFFDIGSFSKEVQQDGKVRLRPIMRLPECGPVGTDMGMVLENYIAVARISNTVFGLQPWQQ